MGQEVLNQANISEEFSVISGIDKIDNDKNLIPIYSDISQIVEIPDVIIDFSIPEASIKILEYASSKNIPVVIATTGFSDKQLTLIKKYSAKIPIFKAANMSYEINIMADIVSKLATMLKDSDIEIIETHHNKKIDAPSGTSLFLADSINNKLNNEMFYEYNRSNKKNPRDKKEIGIHSVRGGTEVGKHSVIFFGNNETLEITHNVTSRSIFATGSLKAAKFIVSQTPGFYDMNSLI